MLSIVLLGMFYDFIVSYIFFGGVGDGEDGVWRGARLFYGGGARAPPCPLWRRACPPPHLARKKNRIRAADIVRRFLQVPKYVTRTLVIGTHETDGFHLVYGIPACPEDSDEYRLRPSAANDEHSFNVTETGRLLDETTGHGVEPGSFCLERFSGSDFRATFVVCSPLPANNHVYDTFYNSGIVLSLPFSLATFLVYALIKELRNLYGKSLMCHVGSQMAAYTSLLTVRLMANDIGKDVCIVFGKPIDFFFARDFLHLKHTGDIVLVEIRDGIL